MRSIHYLQAAILMMAAFPFSMNGHGRNPSVARVDIQRDHTAMSLEVVVVDLLNFSGMSLREWQRFDSTEKERFLMESAYRIVDRIKVYSEQEELLMVKPPKVDLPNFAETPTKYLGIDQLSVKILLEFRHDHQPSILTFWEQIFDSQYGDPIPFQLMIYQKGEMVLLPTEWSAGFLVQHNCNWETQPTSLSKRESLSAAVCNWRNRPAYGQLEIDGSTVYWTIRIPYLQLNEFHSDELNLDALAKKYMSGISVRSDSAEAIDSQIQINLLPMSAHSILHDRQKEDIKPEDALVEFSLMTSLQMIPREITILAQNFTNLNRIYTNVILNGHWNAYTVLEETNSFYSTITLPLLNKPDER